MKSYCDLLFASLDSRILMDMSVNVYGNEYNPVSGAADAARDGRATAAFGGSRVIAQE